MTRSADYDDEGKLRSWLPDGNRPPDHPAEVFAQVYPDPDEVIITYDDELSPQVADIIGPAFAERLPGPERGGIAYSPAIPESAPPPKSETDELLDDLDDRVRRGIDRLQRVKASYGARSSNHGISELHRLNGKIEGLRVVQDWLRSYR